MVDGRGILTIAIRLQSTEVNFKFASWLDLDDKIPLSSVFGESVLELHLAIESWNSACSVDIAFPIIHRVYLVKEAFLGKEVVDDIPVNKIVIEETISEY